MTRPAGRRGLSPVVGTILLVGVVVVLSVLAGSIAFGLTDETDPQPNVVLAMESEAGTVGERWIVHRQGEELDGDRVTLRGVADPDGLAGSRLAADNRHTVWPVAEEVEVVWFGDNDESYVLWEFEVDPDSLLPPPDEGCSWVESESNSGTDQVKIDGLVVNCDVETDDHVELLNDAAVIGDVVSRTEYLDADDAEVYGDVDVQGYADLQDATVEGTVSAADKRADLDNATVESSVDAGKVVELTSESAVGGDAVSDNEEVKVLDSTVSGSATARSDDATVQNATVGGTVSGEKVVQVTDGSSVDGDVVSDAKDAKVLDSTVSGSVTAGGTVKLDGATVEGDVYADPADFDCTDSEIDGQDCSSYSPKDPDDY